MGATAVAQGIVGGYNTRFSDQNPSNAAELKNFLLWLEDIVSGKHFTEYTPIERLVGVETGLKQIFEAKKGLLQENPLVTEFRDNFSRLLNSINHSTISSSAGPFIMRGDFKSLRALVEALGDKSFSPQGKDSNGTINLDGVEKEAFDLSLSDQRVRLSKLAAEAAEGLNPKAEDYHEKFLEAFKIKLTEHQANFSAKAVKQIKQELADGLNQYIGLANLQASPVARILTRAFLIDDHQGSPKAANDALDLLDRRNQNVPRMYLSELHGLDGQSLKLSDEEIVKKASEAVRSGTYKEVDSIVYKFLEPGKSEDAAENQADLVTKLPEIQQELNKLDTNQQAYFYQTLRNHQTIKSSNNALDLLMKNFSWTGLLVPVLIGIIGAKGFGASSIVGIGLAFTLSLLGENDSRRDPPSLIDPN